MPSDTDEISASLLGMVHHGVSPAQLLRMVRQAHPTAKKQDIIHAAFAAIIAIADSDLERARLLQTFAIGNRGNDE